MIRVRKLVLAIAAATSLTSGMAHALGLGEISLQSSLNQPLVAEIELLEIRDLDKAEIIPRLASAEDFSKAGVEREFFLSELKFTPVILANGKGAIRVSSGKPVREPYLNFLVEVVWPSGRVLREYTLLLDPPMYSPETAVAAAPRLPVATPAPSPAPVAAQRTQSAPVDGPFKAGALPGSPVAAPARAESRPAAAAVISADQYKTTKNDTLWEIAQRVQASGSLNQTMLAIQDLNPDAFIGGNINSLKSGQVLRLPDASQVNARSGSEASIAVAEQNSAWRERRSLAPVTARQLDATRRDVAGEAPAQIETKDSLRLVAADAGAAASGSDKGAGDGSKVLSDKLAVTQESLDTSRRQSDELKERVADLQSQMEKLQKLVQLKDDQLARLQADLLAQEKQAAEAASAAEAEVLTAPVPVGGALVAGKPAEEPVVAAAPVAAAPVAAAPVAESAPAQTVAAVPQVDESQASASKPEDAVKATPAPVEVKPAVAVAPVKEEIQPVQISTEPVVEVAPEQASPVDEFLGNPLLVGAAGAGLLVVLLGLMALSRRNAMKDSQKDSQSAESKPFDLEADDDFEADANLPDDTFAGLDDEAVAPEQSPLNAQAADALSQAENYIAYGKFNQAAEFLQEAINNEPQRADLQLKLLEVLAELGDREGFQRQEAELQEMGGASQQLEQLKARYPAMAAAGFAAGVGHVAEPDDFDMDDLISDAPLAAPQDADDAFDLSLEGLDAGIDEEFRAPAPVSNQDLDDFALDIDFAQPSTSAKDDIDFGLTFEEPVVSGASSTPLQIDDLSDFSFELDSDPASTGESDYSLTGDNEISLELPELDSATSAGEDSFSLDSALDLAEDFDMPVAAEPQSLQPAPAEPEPTLEALNEELDQLSASFDDLSLQDEPELLQERDELAAGDDEDFDFLSDTDETATKLDLARAYIEMGDSEGARDILDEVVAEGTDAQQQEARELIGRLA